MGMTVRPHSRLLRTERMTSRHIGSRTPNENHLRIETLKIFNCHLKVELWRRTGVKMPRFESSVRSGLGTVQGRGLRMLATVRLCPMGGMWSRQKMVACTFGTMRRMRHRGRGRRHRQHCHPNRFPRHHRSIRRGELRRRPKFLRRRM